VNRIRFGPFRGPVRVGVRASESDFEESPAGSISPLFFPSTKKGKNNKKTKGGRPQAEWSNPTLANNPSPWPASSPATRPATPPRRRHGARQDRHRHRLRFLPSPPLAPDSSRAGPRFSSPNPHLQQHLASWLRLIQLAAPPSSQPS
jgi:hypothetical protein